MMERSALLPNEAITSRRFYYGWVNVVIAAIAMTSTLPGRTHGLGLVTESILADLAINAVTFARINFFAAVSGAVIAIPVGHWIDRWGVRRVLTLVTVLLGGSVLAMSYASQVWEFSLTLFLVRALGQTALSVVSMAVIGKWFQRRLGPAMGVYAVLLTIGFITTVLWLGSAVAASGWRIAWAQMGWCLLGISPFFFWFTRSRPTEAESQIERSHPATAPAQTTTEIAQDEVTLRQAISMPVFWAVAMGTSAFNLVWSAVTLFNESMWLERGLDSQLAVEVMAILTGTGLLANLVGGAVASRGRVVRLLAVALGILAVALAIYPSVTTHSIARIYAGLVGVSGGFITVVFFSAWGHLFGRGRLGAIQGAAQGATVLASALGPVVMAEGRAMSGSYGPVFWGLSGTLGLLAVWCWLVPVTPALRSPARSGGSNRESVADQPQA